MSLAQEHIEANTLAALVERKLTGEEEALIFAHLSECALCRDWLALNVPRSDRRTFRISPRVCKYAVSVAALLVMALSIAPWNTQRLQSIPGNSGSSASAPHRLSIETAAAPQVPSRLPVLHSIDLAQSISLHSGFVLGGKPAMQLPGVWLHAKLTQASEFAPARFQNRPPAANRIVLMTRLGERWINIDSSHYLQ